MEHAQLIILDEIHRRISNVTVVNGYEFTLEESAIKRAMLTPFVNGDLPAVNYWPTPEILDSKSGQMETRILPVNIEGYDLEPDEPFTDVAIKMANNVIVGLFRDTSAPNVNDTESTCLGGLVSSLVVQSMTPMIGEGSTRWCGFLIELEIKYNIKVGDFSTIQNF